EQTQILTNGHAGGGVLKVRNLIVEGKSMPRGIYSAASKWVQGSGYVMVGDVKSINVTGSLDDPNKTIGAGNIAVLKAASKFKLPGGECAIPVNMEAFPLTLT